MRTKKPDQTEGYMRSIAEQGKAARAGREPDQVVQHTYLPQPVQEGVTITRGQRGAVGWEVKAGSVERAIEMDEQLTAHYGHASETEK